MIFIFFRFIYILDSLNSSSFTFIRLLALKATEPVSEPLYQMAVELINIHVISVQQKMEKGCKNHKKKPMYVVAKACNIYRLQGNPMMIIGFLCNL